MKKTALILLLILMLLFTQQASAETNVYQILDVSGNVLSYFRGDCDLGDEYISGDNQHYRIANVDHASMTAHADYLGKAQMPDVSWIDLPDSIAVSAAAPKKIALYCTHSDESYIKGDGTQSIEGRGGIYDIAAHLRKALETRGVSVELNETTHLPHDAGAYRRSRQTAVALLKKGPDAIFDIHRDGIPDPEEYAVSVGNTAMSKVRLLVGKSNQNKEANLSFAKQIKAVGDKIYPDLIKDIYIGKGTYNQDLAPRSVLLEFGTHTLNKERVFASVKPMAEVIFKAMYGGVTGSAGISDVGSSKAESKDQRTTSKPAAENNEGSDAIIWIIASLLGGIGVFALLSTGGKGTGTKFKRTFSEMTGGLFGKKPPRNES